MSTENRAVLTEGNIPKQLFFLTVPMIFGMLSIVIFNLTDTFFVARLGEEQLAALSFTFPVVMVINSLSTGVGIGAGALISRYVGSGDIYKVRRLTTDSLTLGFFFILLISIAGLMTIKPLFSLLGAEGIVLTYIDDYMSIWYYGSSMIVITMIGNNIIRAMGDTKTPGLIMIISAVINMILDPLLIFGIWFFPRLEIQGAAITTLFSRAIVTAVAIYVLHFRRRLICFKKVSLREVFDSWKEILHIGIPSASIRLALPIGSGVITRLLASEGALVVAGFGVATRIEFFAMAPIMALSSVMSPFVGQNLGAGAISRIIKGKQVGYLFSFATGGILALILGLFATPIAKVFNDNPEVIRTIVIYLRIVPISYGLNGMLQIGSTILNVYQKPYLASGLMGLQIFLLYIPFALVGHYLFGQVGAFSALNVSYVIAGVIAYKIVNRETAKFEDEEARNIYPR